jgi:8-amino-7-oxononanoate synthase
MQFPQARTKYEILYFKYCNDLKEKNLLRELTYKKKSCRIYIDFSSSDYLGLSRHPSVIKKSKEYIEEYGTSSGGSRLLSGNLSIFEDLEQKIAATKKVEAAIVFNSAYEANTSIIPALLSQITKPLVFTDRLVHASIHVGLTTASINQIRYRHLDMNHLENLLKKNKSTNEKFIFSETIFGMDGDVLDLSSIKFLSKKYNAFLYLDESHSVGMYEDDGYGISLDEGMTIGAFSKTLGSCGGFASCSKLLKTYLINKCKGFIYSTALPPAIIGANLATWKLLPTLTEERKKIKQLSCLLRKKLHDSGFDIGNSSTHIIPIIIGSEKDTLLLENYLKQNGILVSAIRPPSVPPNTSRLRITVSVHHSIADIEKLVELLKIYQRNHPSRTCLKTIHNR